MIRLIAKLGLGLALFMAVGCVLPALALDSTQSIPPKVGWNKPSAKRAERADYAEDANTANKAKSAEHADTANTATAAATAGTAAKVDANALSNLPSCASGQVLTVSNGALTCTTVSSTSCRYGTSTVVWPYGSLPYGSYVGYVDIYASACSSSTSMSTGEKCTSYWDSGNSSTTLQCMGGGSLQAIGWCNLCG